ncbi:polyprenol monophosphomannose synthase [Gaiella occulta]
MSAEPRPGKRAVRALICLPTYNERENIEPMLRALGDALGRDDLVLVIDDNSPDGTGELAERLAASVGRVRVEVLHRRRKEGLGPAYLAGFRRALELGAELVLTMDCDFSHDPHDVPRLIAAAQEADVVLGSRSAAGGIDNRTLGRRLISSGGSLYARTILGLPVRDATAGFKCVRREVLERVALDAIHSKGYAFNIELTYRAHHAGFHVVEQPITFTDRAAGGSKMSWTILLEALRTVPSLRLAALAGRL